MFQFIALKRAFATGICLFLVQAIAFSQLKSGFNPNRQGGCVPFTVSFQNATTGASSGVVYDWDFGNGNHSSLKDPSAVFLEEKDYNVTLTATENGVTSVSTKIISGYKSPVVNFNAASAQGCTPAQMVLNSTSTAGSGSISSYFWDFGDGYTASAYSPQTSHIYTAPGKPTVILSVTNNFGCSSTKTIPDLMQINPGVTADFSAKDSFICVITDSVRFINKSSGGGSLTYLWTFGDGTTSTAFEPVHVFNAMGNYTVSLKVTNSFGCTSTTTKTAFLNVGNFSSQLTMPSTACINTSVELKNISSPAPTSTSWQIDGVTVYQNYSGVVNYTFYSPGKHTVQVTNRYGACSKIVTGEITINPLPQPAPFIIDIPFYCSGPVTVAFRDTTPGMVKSDWNFDGNYWPTPVQATGTSVTHTYNQQNYYPTVLTVTDVNGCTNRIQQPVSIIYPYVQIYTADYNGMSGCKSLTKQFKFNSNEPLASFTWNFGNGNTSTLPNPEVTFTQSVPVISLSYTTAKGCTGTVYYNGLSVLQPPKADFTSISGTTICGNTSVTFNAPNSVGVGNNTWLVNGNYVNTTYGATFTYQFQDTGTYTITLIAYNGACRDTLTRVNYIKVVPAFPKIVRAENTCSGDRGDVTFTQASRYAAKWTWNFGDNTTPVVLTSSQATITHNYQATGSYLVTLTVESGSCSVSDMIRVYVNKKKTPVLSAVNTTICQDAGLSYSLTNIEPLAYPGSSTMAYVSSYLFNDGTSLNANGYSTNNTWINTTPYYNTVKPIAKGKTAISVVTMQPIYNCYDTSNFIPIIVAGANAGFKITANNVCYKQPVVFQDTSNAYNTTITSRQWNFGDGQTLTTTQGGVVTHTYASPGYYYATLKITDNSGCTSTSSSASQQVIVNGPKVSFSPLNATVQLNSTVWFSNYTNAYSTYNATYNWDFGDGSTSTLNYPSHTYPVAGVYKVVLTAKDPTFGCADTLSTYITVKDFYSGFSAQPSFISNSKCPPVLYRFQNNSINYVSLRWDFGDGTFVDNVERPTHLYTSPGTYTVTLSVKGYNGLTDVTKETFTIKSSAGALNADILHSCTGKSITLNTINDKNTGTYLWDFGDGQVATGTDTFFLHKYGQAGIYSPSLIRTDSNGCASSLKMVEKIVIDSLSIAMGNLPQSICTPKSIQFNPQVVNVAADQGLQTLLYHWDFGTGKAGDTSNLKNPVFNYTQSGNYPISFNVRSPFGCEKTVQANIAASQGLGAVITGPVQLCQENSAQFYGSTVMPGQPTWKWIYDDGTIVQQQNPPAKTYNIPGNYQFKLIVDHNGCADTVSRTLTVNKKPVVGLPFKQYLLCEGKSVSITANGGSNYAWNPLSGLNTGTGATVVASPKVNTTYTVQVTDVNGCTNKDSVLINVAHPFTMKLSPSADLCMGNSVTLNATGADSYRWIMNTAGLSSSAIANPVAKPLTTTTYTVVGTDVNKCFTDTGTVVVKVFPLPTVDAGQAQIISTGSPVQLQPTYSSDVVKWVWSPATYLNCSNCATPVATPLFSVTYKLTVTNNHGCSAADTVSIGLICSESRVYIPTAFSPNNDGVNDVFAIKGDGIRIVNHFIIYNRYGQPVFERNNFSLQDAGAAWDGTFKGVPVEPGSYVYIAEMSCNDKTFTRRGSVTVVR